MEIPKLKKALLVMSAVCAFPALSFAENDGLYMNGQWDAACAKCWPTPRTTNNNRCKAGDCALQGYYHCKMQNPPLAMDDDPRLISLIKTGECTFAPSVSFNTGEADYIKSLNYCTTVLDKMAGRYILPGEDRNVARNRIDFYLTNFKASILGSSQDQLKLAMDYDLGLGTNQDRNKATQIYNEAADKGVPFAQYAIAARYAYGISVDKDKGKAIEWLNKAINNKPMTRADQKAQEMVTPCAIKLIERLTPS